MPPNEQYYHRPEDAGHVQGRAECACEFYFATPPFGENKGMINQPSQRALA